MMIYYPPYYLVPVIPVIYLDEGEYNIWYNMEDNELNNTYRNINEDIFKEVDEEYVNESIK